jgi:glycosyltransferase involved in cell wall biosynthesis
MDGCPLLADQPLVWHQDKLKVTVLMSVYNGARWLRESIESILAQSFPNFEFIIVDDGSQDTSLEIIRRYAAADPRIRVIIKPNSGLTDSLNVGIEAARGEWIARIDADDMAMPNRLATQLDHAIRDERCVVLGSAIVRIDEEGRECGVATFPVNHKQLCRLMYRKINPIPHSSALFRKAAVCAVGGYRERIRRAQDYDLWLRLSEVGHIGSIDRPLVRYRQHASQVSHENGGLQQMVDGRVALASFMLRRAGFKDPVSAEATDEQFREFWHFVQHSLREHRYIEYRKFVDGTKADLASRSLFRAIRAVFSTLSAPRFLIRLAQIRVFGDRLTGRIVQDWIERGKRQCAD